MAKRKIGIQEALDALKDHGLDVSLAKHQEPSDTDTTVKEKPKKRKDRKGFVMMLLAAQHSFGCGGSMLTDKNVQGANYQSYGPGECEVPSELVGYLKYREQLAKRADERFLEKEQRSYLVVPSGQRSKAVRVDNELLNGGLGSLSEDLMYKVR